ncbi:MAG: glycosyltransferase family 2 protein [Burkholderiaceae bacterium]|nr:glycosyltransferase family 2 protein [Burkholderiaceae bacterium]
MHQRFRRTDRQSPSYTSQMAPPALAVARNSVASGSGSLPTAVSGSVELTVLMPCLNEARTLPACIAKARRFMDVSGLAGEIIVADNGSSDGSQALARSLGARVIAVQQRGYGAALIAGIEAAAGRFVVMGDSDDSYDFEHLQPFVDALRDGAQLVMGNRFAGGIRPGAMPALHRYLGNPVLSFVGRWLFKAPVRDFHCGLRGFDRAAVVDLGLQCSGMEFASEMVVKAALAGLRIAEVPTTLSPDGRDRPPHLRSWRDGWRHLRFLLLFCPRWLFLYPGIALTLMAVAQLVYAHLHRSAETHWPVGIHTQLFAAGATVLGFQTMLFAMGALLARYHAGLEAPHPRDRWVRRAASGPWLPVGGAAAAVVGLALCVGLTLQWTRSGFGALDPEVAMRQIIPGIALLLVGTQSLLAWIFFAAMRSAFDAGRPSRRGAAADGDGASR